jgi:hypothetical protein
MMISSPDVGGRASSGSWYTACTSWLSSESVVPSPLRSGSAELHRASTLLLSASQGVVGSKPSTVTRPLP